MSSQNFQAFTNWQFPPNTCHKTNPCQCPKCSQNNNICEIPCQPVCYQVCGSIYNKPSESVCCEPVYDKPCESLYHKPCESVHHKPCESVHHKPCEPVYHKPCEPVYYKPCESSYHKSCEPDRHKPCESIYHKPCEPVYHKPCEPVYHKSCEPVYHKSYEPVYDKPYESIYHKPCEPVSHKQNYCHKSDKNTCDKVALITTPTGPQRIQNDPEPFPFARIVVWNHIAEYSVGCITYNATNGEFTIPKTGIYSISVYVTWELTPTNTPRELFIYRVPCGTSTINVLAADTRNVVASLSTSITLTTNALLCKGDRIFIGAWQESGGPIHIFPVGQRDNRLSIVLIN